MLISQEFKRIITWLTQHCSNLFRGVRFDNKKALYKGLFLGVAGMGFEL